MEEQLPSQWNGSSIGPGPIGVLDTADDNLDPQVQQLVFGTAERPDPVLLPLEKLGEFILGHQAELFVIDQSRVLAVILTNLLLVSTDAAQVLRLSIDETRWIAIDVLRSLLDGDGPASHARHHGRPGTSVQSKDRIKHRTAGNHRAHNIQPWKRQQGRQEDNEGNSEGNSLRNARTKETKKALEVALT